MSNTKTVMGQASNQYVAPLNVEDVFSTYLYPSSNEVDKPVVNGIDLDGEGGLVWIKTRSVSNNHYLYDTVRGSSVGDDKGLKSNSTAAEASGAYLDYLQFNSDGFTAKHVTGGGALGTNTYYGDMASWTFRKAPKFFDVVTWTGDGTTGRAISHNLGCEVGAIFVKTTSGSSNWYVYNRNLTSANYGLKLNGTDAEAFWGTGNVTDTTFSFDHQNGSGNTYVAYLFAHNDGDGGFGADGDADIIKCGSLTADASGGATVDLGWEPQWLLYKKTNGAQGWLMHDTMRGWDTSGVVNNIYANITNAESNIANSSVKLSPTATGFSSTGNWFGANSEYIYMAIRRGTKVPESATEVFAVDAEDSGSYNNPPLYVSGFPVDFALRKQTNSGANWAAVSRLTGTKWLRTNDTSAEDTVASYEFDFMDGWSSDAGWNAAIYSWMWKRAPNFFDVVAYEGDGTANQTFNHGLTVKPGMIWLKNRSRTSTDWFCWVDDSITTNEGRLNSSGDFGSNVIGTVTDTTVQTLYTNQYATNYNGDDYIAYLFATLDGISKCGSYTGDGTSNSSKVIDCGFTSGARFVIIKSVDGEANNWFMFDTLRGIVVGNDSVLKIDRTTAANSNADYIDPHNSGFIVGCASNTVNAVNVSGVTYIFYAVA